MQQKVSRVSIDGGAPELIYLIESVGLFDHPGCKTLLLGPMISKSAGLTSPSSTSEQKGHPDLSTILVTLAACASVVTGKMIVYAVRDTEW